MVVQVVRDALVDVVRRHCAIADVRVSMSV